MTIQQEHPPETLLLLISFPALLPALAGAVSEADESPSTAKTNPKGVRGKPEAHSCLLGRRNVGMSKRGFCASYTKDCILALAKGTAQSRSPS